MMPEEAKVLEVLFPLTEECAKLPVDTKAAMGSFLPLTGGVNLAKLLNL